MKMPLRAPSPLSHARKSVLTLTVANSGEAGVLEDSPVRAIRHLLRVARDGYADTVRVFVDVVPAAVGRELKTGLPEAAHELSGGRQRRP